MRAMTDTYIKWAAAHGEFGLEGGPADPAEDDVDGSYTVNVIDVFGVWAPSFPIPPSLTPA
jgi:hypothetical protein